MCWGICNCKMKSKKWATTKIGRGVNLPKSKNMLGIKTNYKSIPLQIKKLRTNQRKKILEIKKTLKEIDNHVIAISGLESLKYSSIKRIQNRREVSILSLIRLVSELAVLTGKSKNKKQHTKNLILR